MNVISNRDGATRRGFASLRMAGACAVALSLGGCLGYDGTVQHGYVLDQRTLDQVKIGATAQQVLTALGTPSTTSTVGGDAWYYINQKTERSVVFMDPKIVDQRVVAVYFSPSKHVTRVANYGLQDGVVFDFVSRTTPTGGQEPSFVMNALKGLLRF